MTNISQSIHDYVRKAIQMQMLDPMDQIYVQNRLLAILGLDEMGVVSNHELEEELQDYLDKLVAYAIQEEIIDSKQFSREILEAEIMDLLIPYPSTVNQVFWNYYQEDKVKATDYFYQLSRTSDYIKTRHIAKNVHFKAKSEYGDLEITINLSKPEKDPKEIKAAKHAPKSHYPACALCMENEGYRGHINHAARQNHRIIRLKLGDEIYGFQYSPYVYYNEHSIFLNETHRPMVINRKCFRNLLQIVEQFPHYFAGSNADLPIVGGSILAHDHYQGGRHKFPMDNAKSYQVFELSNYPEVKVELVKWPLSVIRLSSTKMTPLVELATAIHEHWQTYSDPTHNIISHSGETPHNTVTPIARRKGKAYELDIVLRNNRCSEEFPDGIFHPHKDVQHIKKENIGLIEVMGLAILPARLVEELNQVGQYLLGQIDLEQVEYIHQTWAQSLKEKYSEKDSDALPGILEKEVGLKFARVLEDAGVYKQTSEGRAGLETFIKSLNS